VKEISVVDSSGQIGTIPAEQLQDALKQGFRLASQQELSKALEAEQFSTPAARAGAFAAGAARALTFGGSDVALTGTGAVAPSTLKKLEEYNPVESFAGEMTAGIGSLFVPGPQTASTLGRAARAVTAPMRAATELGLATTKAVETALPAATALGRAGQVAASTAAGGALEGALYGAGRVATEAAMGDPVLDAESIISHVGMTALVNGTLSSAVGLVGAGVSGLSKKAAQKYEQFKPKNDLPEAGPAVIETPVGKEAVIAAPEGTLERAMQEMGVESEKQAQILAQSNRLKPNAREVIADSQLAGLPVMEAQISNSKNVQRFQTMLLDSPTTTGEKHRMIFEQGWDTARKNFEEPLSLPEPKTAYQAGQDAIKAIEKRVDDLHEGLKIRYKELDPTNETILIPDESRIKFYDALVEKSQNIGARGGPQEKVVRTYAERVLAQDSVLNLDNLITEMRNSQTQAYAARDFNTYHAFDVLIESTRDFQDREIAKAGARLAKEGAPYAKEIANDIVRERKALRADYAKFKDTLADIAGAGKLGKATTYSTMMEALSKVEPAQLANTLFNKSKVDQLKMLRAEHPEVFQAIVNAKKTELLEKLQREATDGLLSPKRAYKEIDRLPREVRELMFTPDELAKMKATRTWLQSLPEDWGPSKTPRGMMYIDYFASPAKMAFAETRDVAQEAFIKSSLQEMTVVGKLRQTAERTIKSINRASKSIFEARPRPLALTSAAIADRLIAHKTDEELIAQIREIASSPEMLVERLSKGTENINNYAPEIAQQIQISAARAIQFLAAHAPVVDSPFALGEKMTPSRLELNKFSEKLNVIGNPAVILDEAASGSLVPEHVQVVQAVFPALFAKMQAQVIDDLAVARAKNKTIPYRTKTMLSLILNQDLDASITAKAITANQAIMRQAAQAGQAEENAMMGAVKPTQKGLSNLDQSNQTLTVAQASATRQLRG